MPSFFSGTLMLFPVDQCSVAVIATGFGLDGLETDSR